ncbi:uncharacterized protein [Diadema antillarum]|uniref:uncharacterized protein n=1 Tax=Diadema antillarum TaxID=105358 RepID=UPI003A8BC5AF
MDEILHKLEACMAKLDNVAFTPTMLPSSSSQPITNNYVSMVKVNGKPILPPLMTPERRAEMARYRAEAVRRDNEKAERRQQDLMRRVEAIVRNFEASRHTVEESPLQEESMAITSDTIDQPIPYVIRSKPKQRELSKGNPSYSPLKYMEVDEEEWDVRPATPWRQSKQSKPRKQQIAARFGSSVQQPTSSTMRVDESGHGVMRGLTPDVSAISLSSSQAPGASLEISPIAANTGSLPAVPEAQTSQDFTGTMSERDTKPEAESEAKLFQDTTEERYDVSSPAQDSHKQTNTLSPAQKTKMPVEVKDVSPISKPAIVKETVASPLSPISTLGPVTVLASGATASTESQSTSSSSNSALNQTVIDLSHMSIDQGQIKEVQPKESPKTEERSKAQEVTNREVKNETRPSVQKQADSYQRDEINAVQYLSDTESYMSLLGEYSLLPTPGSQRTKVPLTTKEGTRSSFFPDPTSFGETSKADEHGSLLPAGNTRFDDTKSRTGATTVSESTNSVAASEYFGSSLGTLGQSCTLPISLSTTSESTLHGVEDVWEEGSHEVTPSVIQDDGELARATPLGQESPAPVMAHLPKQTSPSDADATAKTNGPTKEVTAVAAGKTQSATKSFIQVASDPRSGVRVGEDIQTPLRQHVRRSSYTLDFPSPALLDAESRHQAPHVDGSDVSYGDASSKANATDGESDVKAAAEISEADPMNPSDDLSSGMKDLNLDEATEAKVLSLQLACLEQMQKKLQRQHEEQMKDLVVTQKRELGLLEMEMEEIRRKAAESALGFTEETETSPVPKHEEEKGDDSEKNDAILDSEDQKVLQPSTASDIPETKEERRSPKLTPRENPDPLSSPSTRKRRLDETSGDDLVEVPHSYIKPSTLVGGAQMHPSFQSPVSLQLLANARRKLTPQDSLDSDYAGQSGLVTVPPSYITSEKPHHAVNRSPTHSKRLVTSPDKATGSSSINLATWASPTGDPMREQGQVGQSATPTSVQASSVSDSFFLNESQTADPQPTSSDQQRPQETKSWSMAITPSLLMDIKFDKMSARVKGYLTRALMRTPKVAAITKTIKDTRAFLLQFQTETPVKRGVMSQQDTRLAHRVLAQLRAAQFQLEDIFHNISTSERMSILRQAREQERENYFTKKVSPATAGDKAKHLSAATRKAMERRRQQTKEINLTQNGPKRQKLGPSSQRPKSAAEERVLRPLQSQKLPGRPATAQPPRTSAFSFSRQSQNLNPSTKSKPFPTKPVVVTRNTAKPARSPSRPSHKPAARPSSRVSTGLTSQARPNTVRSAKSPGGISTVQTKTKSVRRSLYPVTVATSKKPQRKQAESKKP